MKTGASAKLDQQKNHYLAELSQRIAESNEQNPTVRCWSANGLKELLTQIRTELLKKKTLTNSFPRSDSILSWLQENGLAYRLPVTPGSSAKKVASFYLLEVGAGPNSVVSPFELLQAFQPAGVICYFSALSFHGLTTQVPAFHHSALLVRRPPPEPVLDTPEREDTNEPKVARSGLGSLAFTYGETAYYSTRRYRDLVPGTQLHVLDQRIRLRVTDLEQTILDTLAHPGASGGQAVVFEAWAQGWGRVRPATIVSHLKAMGLPLTRRFGAISRVLQLQLDEQIVSYLDSARTASFGQPAINLFRGQPSQSLDPDWNVLVPL
jgi:predicted transcriptional regulator of viral defense system